MKKIIFLLVFPFFISVQTTEVKSNKDSIPQKKSSTSQTKLEDKLLNENLREHVSNVKTCVLWLRNIAKIRGQLKRADNYLCVVAVK